MSEPTQAASRREYWSVGAPGVRLAVASLQRSGRLGAEGASLSGGAGAGDPCLRGAWARTPAGRRSEGTDGSAGAGAGGGTTGGGAVRAVRPIVVPHAEEGATLPRGAWRLWHVGRGDVDLGLWEVLCVSLGEGLCC